MPNSLALQPTSDLAEAAGNGGKQGAPSFVYHALYFQHMGGESSLIGVREVKLPWFFRVCLPPVYRLIPVGHSLLFAVDAVAAA